MMLSSRMQRKGLKTLFILCKRYQLPPSSLNPPPSSLNPPPSFCPFQECNLYSTYSHFDSSPTTVSDLIHLQRDQVQTRTPHQRHDEFRADVERIYRILLKFHTKVPKLELALQQSGVVMRKGLTERVVTRCGDAGNLGYRFFVWASKQPDYRHSHEVYEAMIKSLGKMRQFGTVWAVIEEMRKDNSRLLSVEVFVVLMRRFVSARMVKKAIEVLDEMKKYGCEPDEYVFGCLLDALCKNGNVREAAVLFEDMRFTFTPTIRHFTSLLYGWCKLGRIVEAKHVLVKMREEGFKPDVVVYNVLLNGYAVARQMADAIDLLDEMKNKGCGPNVTSYTTMIQSLCVQGKMEEAMRVLLDMDRSGCEADVVTYTTLISGFVKWHKIDKAYLILDQMIQKGHLPDSAAFMYIMSAHEKKDQLEECLELKEKMRNIGLVPDIKIYNTIIRLSFRLGEVEEAVRMWNEIEANGKSPEVDAFIIMINGFAKKGFLVEACDYFKEMVNRGLLYASHYGILKTLFNSLLRDGKLEMSKDVWSCMVTKGCEPNQYVWTIWVNALFANKHPKEACSYCIDMLDANVMPQPETFERLMQALKELYNIEVAAEITEKVRKMAEERQVTFKMYKRRGVRLVDEAEKAKSDRRKGSTRQRRRGAGPKKARGAGRKRVAIF